MTQTATKTSAKGQDSVYLGDENATRPNGPLEPGKPMTIYPMLQNSEDKTPVERMLGGTKETNILGPFPDLLDKTPVHKGWTYFSSEVDLVVLVAPVAKTLKQWMNDNFGDNPTLNRRLTRILSKLKKSNPVVFERTIQSRETYTREELEAMAQFIGAVRLPRGFNMPKVLDEAEKAYYEDL